MRELPEEQFALYRTGTRRTICRHCKYELYDRRAYQKWRMKHLLGLNDSR